MKIIGIVILIVGIVCVVLAVRRGGEAGTHAAEGPPPPRPARTLMGTGVLCILVGAALTLMSGV
jgi:drug/metabolite transporter (DMT)-like permease